MLGNLVKSRCATLGRDHRNVTAHAIYCLAWEKVAMAKRVVMTAGFAQIAHPVVERASFSEL